MSHQNVVDFLAEIRSDEALQARVGGLQGDGGPGTVQQLLEVATEAGFPFTEQELDDLLQAQAAAESAGELTDDQLESVAGGNLFAATREMQEMSQSFNLQYLQLQQDMQADSRAFTMMSNIMKVKHDTAKSAINNIR